MDRFKKYFSCLMLIALTFSCAAHKEIDHKLHIPPPKTDSHIKDTDLYQPPVKMSKQRNIIAQHAFQSIGVPYKWGGRSPETGFDCSGLSSYIHKMAGIIIPRTAKAQSNKGQIVEKQNLQVGDLVFFKDPKKMGGYHVGVYIGIGLLIHAPGKGSHVTYEALNNPYFNRYYIGSRRYW